MNTTLQQLIAKNEYSQFAPDEAMRNATTASAGEAKVTDLRVDEPDFTKASKPAAQPPASAPKQVNFIQDNCNALVLLTPSL